MTLFVATFVRHILHEPKQNRPKKLFVTDDLILNILCVPINVRSKRIVNIVEFSNLRSHVPAQHIGTSAICTKLFDEFYLYLFMPYRRQGAHDVSGTK